MSDRTTLAEFPIAVAWNVQGDGTHRAFTDQVSRQFSLTLPITPNTTAQTDGLTVVWLGPRSWLLVAESADSRLADFDEKRRALNATGGALFDLSASRVAFRLRGKGATDVLATGCPLDLHPRAFPSGQCRQSVLGHVNALLLKTDELPTFVIMVARSFAHGVWKTLERSVEHVPQ